MHQDPTINVALDDAVNTQTACANEADKTSIPDKTKTYSIADLAKEFDVTPRTLRHYEDEGLIAPSRQGQSRIYSYTDRVLLRWIVRGRSVGFSLNDIKEMLTLYDLGDNRETQHKVTLEKCMIRLKTLEAQRDDLNSVIEELAYYCDILKTIQFDSTLGRWVDPRTGLPPQKPVTGSNIRQPLETP